MIIGLFRSTPMVALAGHVPRKQAVELQTTGDFIEVARRRDEPDHHALAEDDLIDAASDFALQILGKPPAAVRGNALAGDVMARTMMKRLAKEGITAFIDKCTTDWRPSENDWRRKIRQFRKRSVVVSVLQQILLNFRLAIWAGLRHHYAILSQFSGRRRFGPSGVSLSPFYQAATLSNPA